MLKHEKAVSMYFFSPNGVSLILTLRANLTDITTNIMVSCGFYFPVLVIQAQKRTALKPLKLLVCRYKNDHFKSDSFSKKDDFSGNAKVFFLILF